MKVIGICGGSGSGKTTVSSLFNHRGLPVLDADAIYAELTLCSSECMNAITREFGDSVVNSDGSLNRIALGQIVFSSENAQEKRSKLNSIAHKYVLSEIDSRLNGYRCDNVFAVVVDIPLMFECNFQKQCDLTIAVIADKELRAARIMKRDGIDIDSAYRRIDSQKSDDFLIENTDIYIENMGDISALEKKVDEIILHFKNTE